MMIPDTQDRTDGAQDAALLARILSEAAFGLRIAAPGGDTLFANRAHQVASRADPERFATRSFEVDLGDGAYVLDLTLDETAWREREEELVRRAFFDELTGLPNRALFERAVAGLAAEEAAPFAFAIIDLDSFKFINDFYGHDVGDLLLSSLSQRLRACLRPTDLLARIGGDEFALVLQPVGDMDALARDIEWLSQRLQEPVHADGYEIATSASIGVSLYPRDGADQETLRINADRAMYRAKSVSKGRVQFYNSGIEHAFAERSRAEQRVRMAIRDCRVSCAYQPKVEIRTGDVSGVEVLMRWRDEDGLMQPPGDFVGLAVDLGLMDELTLNILAETLDSLDLINEAFGRDIPISINIAAHQAGDARFMETFLAALADSGHAPRFMLELTEEAFIAKSDFDRKILPMIRQTGARISIDDFGTGYSSLSALADITADEVKIDRTFITEVHKRPRSQAVLKAIEALGRSLGMSVVVEGVETFEELLYLQAETRIAHAQGFYFSRPIFLGDETGGHGVPKQPRDWNLARRARPSRQRVAP